MTETELLADLRAKVFATRRPSLPQVGIEAEMLPRRMADGSAVPITTARGDGSLDILRRASARLGWREEEYAHGPRFRLPDGGIVTWEPGGQLEVSTAPSAAAGTLVRELREVIARLEAITAAEGVHLLHAGIDPVHPVAAAEHFLRSERYLRMAAYLAQGGPAGARMMLQTASIQISLDWGPRPDLQWRVLNALTPLLVAIFANSPRYGGISTGEESFRAGVWRRLDPARTGLLGDSEDPAAEYLAFALGAPAILLPERYGERRPFGEWLHAGEVTQQDWAAHLSTLFPEVRPRGHIEVRSMDALPPQWYGAPVALLAGIAYHEPALEAAARLLGTSDSAWLERAGRSGLRDADTAARARELWRIALEGCEALGPPLIDRDLLDSAHGFRRRYTEQSRSPADDWELAPCSSRLPQQLLGTGT